MKINQTRSKFKLLASFFSVLLIVGAVMEISSGSVNRVSLTTNQLINSQIPELREISDTQNLMRTVSNNLHEYYAAFDRSNYVNNEHLLILVKEKIKNILALKTQPEVNFSISENLEKFISESKKFDDEMSLGANRDWDVLREHLYAAQLESKKIMSTLDHLSVLTRVSLEKNSLSAQKEVQQLNVLQLGFSFVILVTSLFIIANLYFRLKDQAELYKRAYYNDITDLPNRKVFEEDLSKYLADSPKNTIALFLISLDRFSLITGSMGYIFGDRLIKSVSEWLIDKLKTIDNIAKIYHFSGNSWLIMLPNCQDKKQAIHFANTLSSISTVAIKLDSREVTCSCSIGICFSPDNGLNSEELLSKLDTSIRAAKNIGGNGYCFYNENFSAETKQWLETENALRHAFEKKEFELFYQPKIHAQTGRVTSSEALLRWRKNGELISPGLFIPIAESSNLIIKIGKWVLAEACEQWMRWQKEGLPPLPIAINISAKQFQENDFPNQVQLVINNTGIPPEMLELEITEEAAAQDPKHVVETMYRLKKIGVTLAIDDFGTGYSSLSHLRHFPVDVLKIDRAFIKDMNNSEKDKSIVLLILQLAKKLNFKVVAEGVETEAQYQQLKHWQCDLIQGFLFSKPLSVLEFSQKITQEQRLEKVELEVA